MSYGLNNWQIFAVYLLPQFVMREVHSMHCRAVSHSQSHRVASNWLCPVKGTFVVSCLIIGTNVNHTRSSVVRSNTQTGACGQGMFSMKTIHQEVVFVHLAVGRHSFVCTSWRSIWKNSWPACCFRPHCFHGNQHVPRYLYRHEGDMRQA